MARYSRRNNNGLAVIILIGLIAIWQVITSIIGFVQGNLDMIILGLVIVFICIIIIAVFRHIKKKNAYKKSVQSYESTPFFKKYNIPYNKLIKERGQQFEIDVFNRLSNEFGDSIRILLNLFIPKVNAVNEYAEIDFVIFHTSGIYVLEVKNLSGPVVGREDQDYWKPFVQTNQSDEDKLYRQNYAIRGFNQFGLYNPLKQNDAHIASLKANVDADYINIVIFSDSMLIGPSQNPSILSLNSFVDLLKSKSNVVYNQSQLENLYDRISKLRVTDRNAYNLHLARINSYKKI